VVLVLGGIGPVLVLLLDAGFLRGPLLAYLGAHYERPIRIDGAVQLKLWSRHPSIVAQHVSIGNPPWVAAGEMARIDRLSVVFAGLLFGHGTVLESLALEGTTLHFLRDDKGHANWQRFDPDKGIVGKGLPVLRGLTAADAHLTVDDQVRHLQFDGTISVQQSPQAAEAAGLHIQGDGQLNGRATHLELSGDPLGGVRRDAPYAFEFKEQSSGSTIDLRGSLPQPFDFNLMDGTFEAAGADLKDLYFLTGVTLVHTRDYHLSGSIERRGTHTRFDQLKLSTGQSDVAATLSIQAEGNTGVARGSPRPRSQLQGILTAGVLHLADFGARATQAPGTAASGGQSAPRLFSDTALNSAGLRRSDAQVRFEAQRVDVGRTTVQSLSGQLKIDHGVLTIPALRGKVLQGSFEARIELDANQDLPAAQVSMRATDLQLAALEHPQGDPPLEGLMQLRLDIRGRGASLHQVAASANGFVSVTLPHGTIRASLAELAGVDLRGVGLALTRSMRATAVRCAQAAFDAHDGTLTAHSIFIDTEPVVIRGGGVINLDTESLDITLRGEPKDVRLLRLDAPLLVRGSLTRPTVAIQTHDAAVRLIDPGRGKDVDCASPIP
jgi:uncharacterized protein involved in outer membrane biogenesis